MPKMHDSMDTTVNELPNEILVKIIHKLDFRSKLRAQLVCKRWRDVIDGTFAMITSLVVEDNDNKRYGDYKPYKLDTNAGHVSVIYLDQLISKTIVRHQTLQRLLSQMNSKFPNIKVLSICLSDCQFKRNVFHSVVNGFGDIDLQQLSIKWDKNQVTVTEAEALALTLNFPNLRVFQFESFYVLIREKTIEVLLKNLPKLDVFILTSVLSNSDHTIDEPIYTGNAFQWINSRIKMIKIPAYLFTDTAMQCMRDNVVNELRDLRLVVQLDDPKCMALIADNFPLLRRFDCLSFNSNFTESQVNSFFADISRLEALETLNLILNSLESEEFTIDYNHIKALKKCTKLRSLSIEETQMAADSIDGIVGFLPQLEKLKLTNNRFPSDPNQCLSAIGHMKHLTHLKLSTYPEIKDQLVIHVINECPQLKHLDLSYCTDITIESIIKLIEMPKQTPIKDIKCLLNSRLQEEFKRLALNLPQFFGN